MTSREHYRTALEAAIRRLHVAGHNNFYVHDDRITFSDTNVMAWIVAEAGSIGLPDADLAVQDDEGHILRAYLLILGNLTRPDTAALARLQRLREQLEARDAAQALRILTEGHEASVPEAIPAVQLPTGLRGIQIERISFRPAELVLDYLRMAKRNIFNSSNTPAAPALIAEGLGLSEAEVITACEELAHAGRLELIRVGDRQFYRIP